MDKNSKKKIGSTLKSRGKNPDGQPNKVDIYVGERLRLRRQMLGLTQEQIAKKLGLTFQQIQKYEKGMNRISCSRLWDFACVLGVEIDFFYQEMPQNVRRKSPRHIADVEYVSDDFVAEDKSPVISKETMELVNAYLKIKNRKSAELLLSVVKDFSRLSTKIQSNKD